MSHEKPFSGEAPAHNEWTNEMLLQRITWGEEALAEISDSITNTQGLTRDSETELIAEYNGIYEETQRYAAEAENRRLAHDFNKEMEVA